VRMGGDEQRKRVCTKNTVMATLVLCVSTFLLCNIATAIDILESDGGYKTFTFFTGLSERVFAIIYASSFVTVLIFVVIATCCFGRLARCCEDSTPQSRIGRSLYVFAILVFLGLGIFSFYKILI
jgi:hypothetical protein